MLDMIFSTAPLAVIAPWVLTGIRIILGAIMIYYGSFKINDLKKTHVEFVDMGFRPGWLWGTLIAVLEFFGGILMVLGCGTGIVALMFGFEMLMGTLWKIIKTDKPFTDYSYDILLFGLCLTVLAFGPGFFGLYLLF